MDLEKELDEFVRTEELLKTSLDRRSRAETVKNRVQQQIRESEGRVHYSKSPIRQP